MHIALEEAQSFLEGTKCNLTNLEPKLEAEQAEYVLGRTATAYGDDIPNWVDETTTPQLVRSVIAMLYAGWYYDRQYSEVIAAEGTTYGTVLRQNAELILSGIVEGAILLLDVPIVSGTPSAPTFYPTDHSSTSDAKRINTDRDDMSIGPALFGSQKVF